MASGIIRSSDPTPNLDGDAALGTWPTSDGGMKMKDVIQNLNYTSPESTNNVVRACIPPSEVSSQKTTSAASPPNVPRQNETSPPTATQRLEESQLQMVRKMRTLTAYRTPMRPYVVRACIPPSEVGKGKTSSYQALVAVCISRVTSSHIASANTQSPPRPHHPDRQSLTPAAGRHGSCH